MRASEHSTHGHRPSSLRLRVTQRDVPAPGQEQQQPSSLSVRRRAQKADPQSVRVGLQLHRRAGHPQLRGAGQRQEEAPQIPAHSLPPGDRGAGRITPMMTCGTESHFIFRFL